MTFPFYMSHFLIIYKEATFVPKHKSNFFFNQTSISLLMMETFLLLHIQNYSMDCYFRQYWRDERLGFTGLKKNHNKLSIDQLSLNVKMLEKIWKPDTYFHNGLSSYLHTITRPNKLLRISEHGDITYSMRYVSSTCQCCNPLQMDNIHSVL